MALSEISYRRWGNPSRGTAVAKRPHAAGRQGRYVEQVESKRCERCVSLRADLQVEDRVWDE